MFSLKWSCMRDFFFVPFLCALIATHHRYSFHTHADGKQGTTTTSPATEPLSVATTWTHANAARSSASN